jgi:hypothetical protein
LSDLPRRTDLYELSLADPRAPFGELAQFGGVIYELGPVRKQAALRRLHGVNGTSTVHQEMARGASRYSQALPVRGPIYVSPPELPDGHAEEGRYPANVAVGDVDEAFLTAAVGATGLAFKAHTRTILQPRSL